ncbi:MAG TPA: hypothetical protein VKH83_12235, partial [Methylomirabilota bacterium]|nr:hypothetical protein [Methylomirabilota bacterium]
MTAGAIARRLIAAAGLGLGLAASAAGVESRPDPDACRALPASYYPIDPEERRPRASRPDEIVVPVAIHFMNADVPEAIRTAATYDEGDKIAKPGQRVQDIWTRQNVRRFFKQDGLINEVLAVLDVRLALVRVEECRYDPGRLRGDGQQVDWIYTPLANRSGARRLFQEVNERYRFTDTPAVDVFLWWSIVDGKPSLRGYGGSVARGGPAV